MGTSRLSATDIKRSWHLIDAKNKILGRLAVEIARLLMGKNKPYFVPYLDCGDYVVIINAAKIKVSGRKADQKLYIRHSGYPGGLKIKPFSQMKKEKPEEIIYHAVKGMLPHNKLGRMMIKRLYVFTGEEHKFKEKFTEGEKDGN